MTTATKSKYCQVIFKDDLPNENPYLYTYLSNDLDLKEGDEVFVQTNKGKSEGEAVFVQYLPEQFVARPVISKVLRVVEQEQKPVLYRSGRKSKEVIDEMSRITVSFLRRLYKERRWANKDDIIAELENNGFKDFSFDSFIKSAMDRSKYIDKFQKNAYIYRKREEA